MEMENATKHFLHESQEPRVNIACSCSEEARNNELAYKSSLFYCNVIIRGSLMQKLIAIGRSFISGKPWCAELRNSSSAFVNFQKSQK